MCNHPATARERERAEAALKKVEHGDRRCAVAHWTTVAGLSCACVGGWKEGGTDGGMDGWMDDARKRLRCCEAAGGGDCGT